MRDIVNRHKGLPERTPEMLFQIITKFTRGAVTHYDLIQEKKRDVLRAFEERYVSGDDEQVSYALTVLFWEFHFYVTCWLQVELALYRLIRMEKNQEIREVMERYRAELDRHIHVRRVIDQTREAVQAQVEHFGQALACVPNDQYWFDGVYFTVDDASVATLRQLHKDVLSFKN